MNTKNIVAALVVSLLFAAGLQASRPAHWTVSSQDEFLEGEFEGVSLTSDGKLILAPELESVLDTGQPLIHSAVADALGNLYFGTASEGKIFRVPARGQAGQWADLDENGVFGLAVDSQNRLYAATSPEGKIYRLDGQGKAEVFFDPKEKYIWDLTIEAGTNHLLVATGPQGVIYRVDPRGEGTVFYDSAETHIVSLGWDLDGNLLGGTASSGLLLRITNAASAFSLYDSAMNELKAMTTDRYGNIYAIGLAGGETEATSTAAATTSTATATATTTSTTSDTTESSVKVEGGKSGKRLEVYRISKEGLAEIIYSADKALAFDLHVQNDGTVLVATGEKGRTLAVGPQKFLKLLSQAPDEQVTRLVNAGGNLYVATSNLGKVYRLSTRIARKGIYESKVLDAQVLSQWGKIWWQIENASGSAPALFTRSGNTERPDGTWSKWSGPYQDSQGTAVEGPASRYLQWKVEFTSSGEDVSLTSESNALESVSISYLQKNVAPIVSRLTVNAPGAAYIELPTAPAQGGAPLGGPGSAHARSLPASVRALESSTSIPPRQVYIPGSRSFSWSATDPNRDDLVFSIQYRGRGESAWRTIEKDLDTTHFTLDGASLPDGIYQLRVVASDHLSNPPQMALTGSLTSKEFVISNTAPRLDVSEPQVQGNSVTIHVVAQATASRIYQLEYSLDGKEWIISYPTDQIADSSREEFDLKVDGLNRGEHIVSLRVADSVGNLGTGKTAVTIP